MASVQIEIPFEGDQPLVLDDAGRGAMLEREFSWLLRDCQTIRPDPQEEGGYNYDEGMARIFTATAILWNAKAGTIAECLATAIIWERG